MARVPGIMERLARLFAGPDASAVDFRPGARPDPLERLRPSPRRKSAPPRSEPTAPTPVTPSRSAVDEDPYLLWQETEFFGRRPPADLDATHQRPIAAHLWVVAGVAWLFTIDPVFRALTPRHFAGIPGPQLLAVFFVLPILLCTIMWVWARVLGPHARVFVRTQALHWKRWLLAGIAFLWVRSALG
jgi:hypothetical protein